MKQLLQYVDCRLMPFNVQQVQNQTTKVNHACNSNRPIVRPEDHFLCGFVSCMASWHGPGRQSVDQGLEPIILISSCSSTCPITVFRKWVRADRVLLGSATRLTLARISSQQRRASSCPCSVKEPIAAAGSEHRTAKMILYLPLLPNARSLISFRWSSLQQISEWLDKGRRTERKRRGIEHVGPPRLRCARQVGLRVDGWLTKRRLTSWPETGSDHVWRPRGWAATRAHPAGRLSCWTLPGHPPCWRQLIKLCLILFFLRKLHWSFN